MPLRRRFPLHTRPLPFLAGWTLVVLGVALGFSWIWQTTVFSGSLLIQTRIPTQLIVFEGVKILWLAAAVAGIVLLLLFSYGTYGQALRGGWAAPKWRFYPVVFLLGLFLAFFGAYWLFDLRFAFDNTPGGWVMFTTLNYSGLLGRPFIGAIGFILLTLGAFFTFFASIDFRIPRPRPAPDAEPIRGTPRPAAHAVPEGG